LPLTEGFIGPGPVAHAGGTTAASELPEVIGQRVRQMNLVVEVVDRNPLR
jgi:hypothetical protein